LAEDYLYVMCKDVKEWINHTKEGYPRKEQDLIYFDRLWCTIIKLIIELQKRPVLLDEEEKDIVKMLKYEGTLYRIHKKYKKKEANYGVIQTDHYVSWTKTNDFNNLYWLSKDLDFVTITAKTTPQLFAIDLTGFNDYVKKYYYPDYLIGSPAILKEQEVVFPIMLSTVQDITPKNGSTNLPN
jgi:hypothetical protein